MLKVGNDMQDYKGCNIRWSAGATNPDCAGSADVTSAAPAEDGLGEHTHVSAYFRRGNKQESISQQVVVNWSSIGGQGVVTARAYANMIAVACEVAEVVEASYEQPPTEG